MGQVKFEETDMPVSEMLAEGINLMLIGMGVVFVFLSALVVSVMLMSRIANAIHDPIAATATDPQLIQGPGFGSNQAEIIAAITSAIHQYRKRHRN